MSTADDRLDELAQGWSEAQTDEQIARWALAHADELIALAREGMAARGQRSSEKGPRRRVVVEMKIEGDDWSAIQGAFNSLATDIAMRDRLSSSVASGGYSSGYTLVSSEDESITHESWVMALEAYLTRLPESAPLPTPEVPHE